MQIPGPAPVVVGVNGTAAGLAAARLGAREAVTRGQPLRILHVFAWPGMRYTDDPSDYASARQEAGRIVEEAVATAARSVPGVRGEGLVVDGQPVRELLRRSRTAGLLVLGADDPATGVRLPLDPVLVQVVSRARCPVVVAHGVRPPAGPLLVAVDGSPSSWAALRLAAAEARRRGVTLEIAHVAATDAAVPAGRRLLDRAAAACPGELVEVRRTLLVGDPAPTLVRTSRRARMMILGPRGTGGGLLGAVAGELLRHCACPTLFVHGDPAGDDPADGALPAGALMS
ncbi:universal stress protein [Couchioplanes caeruleus]|uniref:Universal stress protein family protein n=1 Tax=Couchioplanes caeruleus TaxID=56438 RepID=A0A3N1GVA5_9ACTN|nr:universal stress protein [Couchioplanes caeruleus]ROP34213.1 universal stress protein family protein [Couchioplanes caeruleus]